MLVRGGLAGLFSGFVFLVANMGWAVHQGKPAAAPLAAISTIFHAQDMPKPVMAGPFGSDNLIVGLITHTMLTMIFGIVFALIAVMFLQRRRVALLAGAGLAYGLVLYVVNFQILGRIFFPWFTNAMGPSQGFEIFIHAIFGLLLVPFFLGAVIRARGPVTR